MTVERGPAQAAYDGAATAILGHLNAGRDVAWLCEGDPLFYGSAMYLLARLAARRGSTSSPASPRSPPRPLRSAARSRPATKS